MIDYKYKVGNYVKFKTKFDNPTCVLTEMAGTVVKITGFAPPYCIVKAELANVRLLFTHT